MKLSVFPGSLIQLALFYPGLIVALGLFLSTPGYALEFPPTGSVGAPSRTVGGGMRGNACTSKGTPLTAIVPENGVNTLSGKQATLFVYVPKGNAKSAELSVTDESGNQVHLAEVPLKGGAGIMQVSVPEKTALKLNQKYYWEFAIVCDPQDRTKDQVVQGILQRVELKSDLQNALKQAPLLKRAELYAKAKIWQETLLTAAELRNSNPKAWEELLKSVKLTLIANEPFTK